MNKIEAFLNKKLFVVICLVFLISRCMIFFVGYLGINLFPNYEKKPEYSIISQSDGWERLNLKLPSHIEETKFPNIKELGKFDSGFYLNIAKNGYDKYKISEKHSAANWVFFPFYPLLIKFFSKILYFMSINSVAVLLSNICFFISLIFIYHICLENKLTNLQAINVIFFISIYPTSIYFSIPYTESLFLLLSSATLFYGLKKKWFIAFMFAGLSTITRVPGFINICFLVGLIIFNFFKNKDMPFYKNFKYLIYFLLSLVPFISYLFYMKSITGDFLAPFHEQSINWFRSTTIPFINLYNFVKNPYFIAPGGWDNGVISFSVSIAVLFVLLTYVIQNIRDILNDKTQLVLFIYAVSLIVIPFASSDVWLTSVVRYMMVCIPFYIYLSKLLSKYHILHQLFLLFFVVLNVIITTAFFNHYYFVV
ncbi:hypothetical protein GCM10023310_01870 [Paenibacillus vulneris]|uniref:Mannosyltransferase family protein n=1 Tax=Paenibacillus vulneris TaxID=1133364 RepID=A0ABW3UG69_9BACL